LLWIQHLDRLSEFRRRHRTWPITAMALPLVLLAAVKLVGLYYYHKPIWWVDVATAIFGIAAATLVSCFIFLATAKKQTPEVNPP
jgi:membrane protein YdbS with pleckstrin-like domain